MMYNAEDQYDRYYAPSARHPDSIYSDLYGEYPIFRLKGALITLALQAAERIQAEGGETLKIVDFGCGNGRYYPVFSEIASLLLPMGMKLELQAYDISSVGLEQFQQHLRHLAFKEVAFHQNFTTHTADSESYRACSLRQDNMTVHFVHGNIAAPMEEIGNLLGPVDITAMLFGVLGHVPGRASRQEMLHVLGDISEHALVTTVANRRHVLKGERRFYDTLRACLSGINMLDELKRIKNEPQNSCKSRHSDDALQYTAGMAIAALPVPRSGSWQ